MRHPVVTADPDTVDISSKGDGTKTKPPDLSDIVADGMAHVAIDENRGKVAATTKLL